MSGGFFRGTSADQDTRFSNKQAKLLKSQKFAPELDHLVDMTKVKIDVIKPWIANRATELLGFEDEVLINFIYGLLDGKDVDGKQIQIQLTGFMEKNTGKFMKELWSLLLSAQKNFSGVPQQFLDAKEEETRKKKADADRITHEIQKRREKEGKEMEQEKHRKLDTKDDSVAVVEDILPRAPSVHDEEDKEPVERHGSRSKGRDSKSPHSPKCSLSPRNSPLETKSDSRSFSNSLSYSDERHKSRSISRSPQVKRRSASPKRHYHSSYKRSISPRRKRSPWSPRSPPLQKSPHFRWRSTSHSRHRSPSPMRRRLSPRVRRRSPSPLRQRSPSPLCRRSPSPLQRRSPVFVRRRKSSSPTWSPSPIRRRSPYHLRRRSPSPHWSPSPIRRRRTPSPRRSPSPLRRRRSPSPFHSPSPLRRKRSPSLHRLQSPLRRRRSPSSPSPIPRSLRYRGKSPMRLPRKRAVESQISPPKRNRSGTPDRSHSPSFRNYRNLRVEHDGRVNGVQFKRNRDDSASQRSRGKRSPPHSAESPPSGWKASESLSRQTSVSLRSPRRDLRGQSDGRPRNPVSSPSASSVSHSRSPENCRMAVTSISPVRKAKVRATRHVSPGTRREEENNNARINSSQKIARRSPSFDKRKKISSKDSADLEDESPARIAGQQSVEVRGQSDHSEMMKTDRSGNASIRDLPDRRLQLASHLSEVIEYGPGRIEGESFPRGSDHDGQPSSKKLARHSPPEGRLGKDVCSKRTYSREGYRANEKYPPSDYEYSDHEHGKDQKSVRKADRSKRENTSSGSDGNEDHRLHHIDKRKEKRNGSREMLLDDDEAEYDSHRHERKEAKRRRKEEKRLRKEEKRRKREERHRRKEERRAGKMNAKSVDTVTPPSDFEEKQKDAVDSDDDIALRRESHPRDAEETESEQKKLEIELRKKALESLRAKKAISR